MTMRVLCCLQQLGCVKDQVKSQAGKGGPCLRKQEAMFSRQGANPSLKSPTTGGKSVVQVSVTKDLLLQFADL